VLFKLIAALIAIAAFPFTAALMRRLGGSIDGTTLLAAYHTAYNLVGVAVLLPATPWFTRVVERLLPSRQTALERALDPSALASPVIAIETARRVVAGVLEKAAASVSAALSGQAGASPGVASAGDTLEQVRDFLSELQEPPESDAERMHLTSMLHALDHTARLAELIAENGLAGAAPDTRAAELCARTMHAAQEIGGSIVSEGALSARAAPIGWAVSPALTGTLAGMEQVATELAALQRSYRAATLAAVAPGSLTAADALARIEAAGWLDRVAHHAWRSATHLLGRDAH
jgi:phosphate:Na+ symporter